MNATIKSFLILFLYSIFVVLFHGCVDPASIDDRIDSIEKFPNKFEGLTHDIVFVSDSVITRIDKNTNEVYTYPSHTIKDKPHSIRLTSDGRYVYFIDRSKAWGSVGPLKRLDLHTGDFTNAERSITESGFSLLNDTLLTISSSDNPDCIGHFPSSFQLIKPLKSSADLYVCTALDQGAEEFQLSPEGRASGVINKNGSFFLYYTITDYSPEAIANRYTKYRLDLEITNYSISVTSVDSLFSTEFSTKIGTTGRYAIFANDNGLHLKDLLDSSTRLIDPDLDSIGNSNLHRDDTFVVVKKRREYSREFFLHDGYHVYHIPTGKYTQILPESLGMDAFRISPDGKQMLFLASFNDNSNWHVTVSNSDGSNAAVVSERNKRSVMPRFRRAE